MRNYDAETFLDKLFLCLGNDGMDVSGYTLDHICYRVATTEEYEEVCREFSERGKLLSETLIGGRMISTYRLHTPIIYKHRKIWCVEIPSPKHGSPYQTGWEHAEFVIDISFDGFMQKYPNIKWHTDTISKTINPDISMKYPNISVKFHQNSIEYAIEYLE